MSFKKASKIGLRIQTSKGLLTVEQTWSLTLSDLKAALIAVEKTIAPEVDSDKLSFLTEDVKLDDVAQLRFDILKEIYIDKKKEQDEKKNAAEVKLHNQKIQTLIAAKQEEKLQSYSLEQLEAMLK